MFARRTDLALNRDTLGRFLPWLIAFMVFLAILAASGLLVLNAVATHWDVGVRGTLTVQVPPAADPGQDEDRMAAVLSLLAAQPDVARYEVMSDADLLALIEPWVGDAADADALPLPRLIDVQLEPDAALNPNLLERDLQAQASGVLVDDHRVWLSQLVDLIELVELLAAAVLAFIAIATVGTVVLTTRTALAIHHDAIEVLHFIGAQDSYIARQFANRALVIGLKGGLLGFCLAIPALGGIAYLAGQTGAHLLPDLDAGLVHLGLAVALAVGVALLAMWTARSTVMRNLKRMR